MQRTLEIIFFKNFKIQFLKNKARGSIICLVETSYFFDPFKNHINYSITCMKHVMIIFQTEYQMKYT